MSDLPSLPSEPKPYAPSAGLLCGTLADFAAALREKFVRLGIEHEGQEFGVELRRLTSREMEMADDFVRGIQPPVVKPESEGLDKYGYDDPAFVKAISEARPKQSAMLIHLSLKGGIPIAKDGAKEPRERIDELVKWMHENLPDNAQATLVKKIVQISGGAVIDRAVFF